jgi:hypothetical protein
VVDKGNERNEGSGSKTAAVARKKRMEIRSVVAAGCGVKKAWRNFNFLN